MKKITLILLFGLLFWGCAKHDYTVAIVYSNGDKDTLYLQALEEPFIVDGGCVSYRPSVNDRKKVACGVRKMQILNTQ